MVLSLLRVEQSQGGSGDAQPEQRLAGCATGFPSQWAAAVDSVAACGSYLPSLSIARAALRPGAPMMPPPGWAPEPQRYRFRIGVR